MDILWIAELLLSLSIGFVAGIGVAWYVVHRDTHRYHQPPARPLHERPCIECETCGSVTAHLVDGMCAICQRMYKK